MTRWKLPSLSTVLLRRRAWTSTVLVVVLQFACADGPQVERRFSQTAWDTVWQATGSFMDSLVPSPALLAFNRGTLFVVDRATPRVVALDAETGAYQWKVGRRGAGPEEFAGVSAMFAERTGGVGVVDIRNRRVSVLSGSGEFVFRTPTVALGQQPNQVCPFGASGFVVADVFGPGLLDVDTTGAIVNRRDPLWPDLAAADLQSRHVLLRSDGTGKRCLVALATGRGFALLSPGDSAVLGQYVETFDVYGVGVRADEGEMKFWATSDAAFSGDTVLVLFSGRTPERARLIDRYSAVSGRYLDSDLLPITTNRIAAGDGMLFVVDTSNSSILALRPRR